MKQYILVVQEQDVGNLMRVVPSLGVIEVVGIPVDQHMTYLVTPNPPQEQVSEKPKGESDVKGESLPYILEEKPPELLEPLPGKEGQPTSHDATPDLPSQPISIAEDAVTPPIEPLILDYSGLMGTVTPHDKPYPLMEGLPPEHMGCKFTPGAVIFNESPPSITTCPRNSIYDYFSKDIQLPSTSMIYRRAENLENNLIPSTEPRETQDQIIRDMMNTSAASMDNTTYRQEVFSLNHSTTVTMDKTSAPMGYHRPENLEDTCKDKHCHQDDNVIT